MANEFKFVGDYERSWREDKVWGRASPSSMRSSSSSSSSQLNDISPELADDSHIRFMADLSGAFEGCSEYPESVTYTSSPSSRGKTKLFRAGDLPTSILVNLLHCLPNTETLYGLVRSSRVFSDLFRRYKSTVLFSVLERELHAQAFECLRLIRTLDRRKLGWLRNGGFEDLPTALLPPTELRRLHDAEARFLRERADWDTFSWRELILYLNSLKWPHVPTMNTSPNHFYLGPIVDIRQIFLEPLLTHYHLASAPTAHYDYRDTFRMRISYWIDEDLNSDDWWRRDYWKRVSMGGAMFGGYKAWERKKEAEGGWITQDFFERNGLLENELLVDDGNGTPRKEVLLYKPGGKHTHMTKKPR